MILGMLLSRLGFARLVRTAYPAFGLVSLVILAGLIAPGLGGKKERAPKDGIVRGHTGKTATKPSLRRNST